MPVTCLDGPSDARRAAAGLRRVARECRLTPVRGAFGSMIPGTGPSSTWRADSRRGPGRRLERGRDPHERRSALRVAPGVSEPCHPVTPRLVDDAVDPVGGGVSLEDPGGDHRLNLGADSPVRPPAVETVDDRHEVETAGSDTVTDRLTERVVVAHGLVGSGPDAARSAGRPVDEPAARRATSGERPRSVWEPTRQAISPAKINRDERLAIV
jgi:hypothetical protein